MKKWRWLCMSLAAFGAAVSGYLLARTFALLTSAAGGDMCAAVFGRGCDEALISNSSWQLGIPLAGWGVVYYVTMAAIFILAWVLDDEFAPVATSAATLLAAIGAAASAALLVVIATGRVPLCPLCLVVHAVNFLLAGAVKRLDGRSLRAIGASLAAGLAYVLGREAARPAAARWSLLGLVFTGLVAIATYQWVLIQSERRGAGFERAADIGQLIAQFEASERKELPLSPDDPRLGPAGAPVELVVFSDFQCPFCETLAGRVYALLQRFPNQLTIVFKHFPLGEACNPRVTGNAHPYACLAARAAESARRQGKFWEFHDALFDRDLTSDEAIDAAARETGLDPERFASDRDDPSTFARVRDDVELAMRVGVDGTPTIFVNGRRAPGGSLELLEALIDQQLDPRDP